MKNERWNIGDWVVCINVEPAESGKVIAHHPEGEFITVQTIDGNEYFYPEATDDIIMIKEEPQYNISPTEITDIDIFFLHLATGPKSISGAMSKDISKRAMNLTNIKAKQSACYYLSLAPLSQLNKSWRDRASYLAGDCRSLHPMLKGFNTIRNRYKPTPTKSSGILN